ncbi:quinone-dependent dihydroorotate dehydrogenase [Hoeflea sp. TYP-13]|uniref:quinone-dependent dihydroorotate dehydrogenase n=1 Tax=Hoeflea sp. TYP-13 TaxID=3230023 RepID=UPI0034C6BE71
MDLFYTIARRALFTLEPEIAHKLSILALKSGALPGCPAALDARLAVKTAGLSFSNPLGIAAGFDKNAEVPMEVLRLGFGFTEIGSVTPKPQPGNPKPRIFRLPADQAVINRFGFNNDGHAVVLERLNAIKGDRPGPIGVNVGANKDSEHRIADYALGIEVFYAVADYFTVNISSPNTPGLRDLQAKNSLAALLEAVLAARSVEIAQGHARKPIFLKVAPDLAAGDLEDIAELALEHALDGLIISNTTLSRSGLSDDRHIGQAGGVSGRPLFERSTIVLAKLRKLVGPSMTIVGVGGVDSAAAALEKIRAGADLVQLYTGFVYQGPGLVRAILTGLSELVAERNVASITELRDTRTEEWVSRPMPQ